MTGLHPGLLSKIIVELSYSVVLGSFWLSRLETIMASFEVQV